MNDKFEIYSELLSHLNRRTCEGTRNRLDARAEGGPSATDHI